MRARWLIAAAVVGASAIAVAGREAQIETAESARAIIAGKLEPRRTHSRARLLALYRASSITRSIFEPDSRWSRLRARADLIRVVRRDLAELEALERELAWVRAAARDLEDAPAGHPRPGLTRPVEGAAVISGFGPTRTGRVTSVRQGVELAVEEAAPVRAPVSGTVVYSGPVANLGETVVIEHDGFWITLGPVALERPQGATVARGEVMGRTRTSRLYLELRRIDSRGGTPLDPQPFADP